jgi:hypothetical protein
MKNWTFALKTVTAAGILTVAGWAAEPAPSPISPGNYRVSVMPNFNHDIADRIQDKIGKIPGLDDVRTRLEDSSIHFTVKVNTTVDLSQLQKELARVDSGAVMTSPVLDHTLTANPGL